MPSFCFLTRSQTRSRDIALTSSSTCSCLRGAGDSAVCGQPSFSRYATHSRRHCQVRDPSLVLGTKPCALRPRLSDNKKTERNTQLKRWTFVRADGTDVSPLSGCLHHLFDNVLGHTNNLFDHTLRETFFWNGSQNLLNNRGAREQRQSVPHFRLECRR